MGCKSARKRYDGHVQDDPIDTWLKALEARHLASLTASEVGRALRALSSCYVERREKLASGGALNTAGKRAAFALFYAPLHFLVTRAVVQGLDCSGGVSTICDLGCGTGAAGAAWALEAGGAAVHGVDRNAWAVAEAQWTLRTLGLHGRAVRGDLEQARLPGAPGAGILAAYTVNELPDAVRAPLLPRLLDAHRQGSRILIVEPIARRMSGWWDEWATAFEAAGGGAREWRFPGPLPDRQRQLGRAAGLDPRELTARTLFL